MLRMHEGKYVFSEKIIGSVTALDLIDCLKQIKQQRFLLTCAPISELPYYISITVLYKGLQNIPFPINLFYVIN